MTTQLTRRTTLAAGLPALAGLGRYGAAQDSEDLIPFEMDALILLVFFD